MKISALRWLAPVLWMGVIFWFSSREGDELNGWLPWFQQWFPGMSGFNWGHFVSYFILAAAFAYAFGGASLQWRTKTVIILLCLLYGISDEYHQSFVPGRSPDVQDLINDTLGAALAMLALTLPPVRNGWRRIFS
ncbi:hypothetical protein BG53_02115 [Paenibacillus darwinianus]|uniref:VanZ-like domain-containing protein n=1 Tax=Paenibacillus darwinianus TaxID=1380763 RepID=A0A9W5S0F0_9BACL|nr:hypothetical protein BG52_02805 [Paenibacillus darwinianus]EXX88291.1 hypothetical protein BG53_02115 [Paenibacillus darwinianus]EXX89907.1 hypothetical protein CH50_00620 [Paenibacillus darwinianus]